MVIVIELTLLYKKYTVSVNYKYHNFYKLFTRGEGVDRTFKSIEDVKKRYFPGDYKKEQWDSMTPAEKGVFLAQETITSVRKDL